jgi:ATP-dependent protease HslVU (ClpYQ) peptidase subunit
VTVVAWDGKTLAADRQATRASMVRAVRKVFRLRGGELVGICGLEAAGRELIRWYEEGQDPAKYPPMQNTSDWARLIVIRSKEILEFEQRPVPLRVREGFFAWGSGSDFAMGAMATGASAVEAVRIASRFSADCGLGIDVVRPR